MATEPQTAWEYRRFSYKGDPELNALGTAGWEIVGDHGGYLIAKRPALSFRDQVTLDQKRRYYGEWGLPVAEDSEEAL